MTAADRIPGRAPRRSRTARSGRTPAGSRRSIGRHCSAIGGNAGLSAWLYLVLAHLVADFVLQPYELVELKRRPVGLAIHTGIHVVVTTALVAPFLPGWWVVVPLMGIVHYFIDGWKVGTGVTRGPRSLWLFLLDQVFHFVVIVAAVRATGTPLGVEVIYGSVALTGILYFATPYVATAFAGAILQYQVAAAFYTRANPTDLLLPRLRAEGIVMRGLALTLVLFQDARWWWLGALPFAGRILADRTGRGRWIEAATGFGLALALGMLFR